MIAAAAAIEEALALLSAGTAEASAGARAAGAGLNDLDKSTNTVSRTLGVDFVKSIRETIKKLDELADEIIQLKGGAEKYGKQNDSLIAGAIIYDQILKENYKSAMGMTAAALVFNDTLMSFTKAALKQNDLLVKGYQKLSEFGAVDSTGLRGVLDTIKRVGASPETMDFVLSTIQRHSEDLAIFGGTVSQGAKRFTSVVEGLLDPADSAYQALTNLGYTNEDILKYAGSYASQTSRMMNSSAKDTALLKQETMAYLVTLAELAELTGVSRDQQMAAAEELKRTTEWRLYLRQLEQSGQGDLANTLRESMTIIMAKNKDQGLAILDRILNKGPTTEKSAAMGLQVDNATRVMMDLARSGADAATITSGTIKRLGTDSAKVLDTFGTTLGLSKEFQQRMGVTDKTFDMEALSKGQDAALASVKANTKLMTETGDAALNSEARRKQLEMAYANYQQELYFNMAKTAVPAMELFVQGLIKLAKGMDYVYPELLRPAEALKEFDKLDKANKLNDITKEQIETTQKLIANQKSIIEQEKIIAQEKAKGQAGDADAQKRLAQHNEKLKELQRQREQLEKTANEANEKSNKLKQASNTTQSSNNTQNVNELLAGLRIKQGPEGALRPGGTVLPETAKAAQEFAKLFPNYTQFNAFDDKHHQGKGGSLHPTGRAFDVGVTEKPSDAVLNDLKEKLKEFGVTNLKYESKGEQGSTGNHIHVEVDPTQFKSKKVSMSVPDYSTMDNTNMAKTNIQPNSVVGQVGQDNTIMVSKLDDLKTLFDKSLRVQEEILTHTKLLA